MRALLAAAALGLGMTAAPVHAQEIAPIIDIAPEGTDSLRITGLVQGLSDTGVHAELRIRRSGPSGNVDLRQGRDLMLSGDTRESIGSSVINAGPGARVIIELTVTREDAILARAQTVLGAHE